MDIKTIDGLDHLWPLLLQRRVTRSNVSPGWEAGNDFWVHFFLVGGVCLEVIKYYHMANIEIKMSLLFGYHLKHFPIPVQEVRCFSFSSFFKSIIIF